MLKLGKKPARPGAVKLKFGAYFHREALPTPPLVFGHERIGRPWGMFANDEFSCCVFAGAAHEHMTWSHEGGNNELAFTDDNVLADYAAVTGFKRDDPDTDGGTDMEDAAKYRRNTGVTDASGVRHKIDSYTALNPHNLDDLLLATWLTGAIGIGLRFPNSAMDQFDKEQPWSVVKGARSEGGHYVTCIGRNHVGNLICITWGRIHAMTPEFVKHYCDEAICYISLDVIKDKTTPEGFDEAALRSHVKRLAA